MAAASTTTATRHTHTTRPLSAPSLCLLFLHRLDGNTHQRRRKLQSRRRTKTVRSHTHTKKSNRKKIFKSKLMFVLARITGLAATSSHIVAAVAVAECALALPQPPTHLPPSVPHHMCGWLGALCVCVCVRLDGDRVRSPNEMSPCAITACG